MKRLVASVLGALFALGAGSAQADQQIRIGGSGIGGTFYVFAGAVATLVDKYVPGYTATALPAGGSAENIRKLRDDQIDLAMVVPDAAYYAHRGEGPLANLKYSELRTVTNTYSAPFMVATLASSDINSIADLKGKRVAVSNPGGLEHFYADVLLQAYGLSLGDITPVPMAIGDRGKAMGDRNVDAAVFLVGLSSAAMQELTSLHEVRLLPLKAEAIDQIVNSYPFYSKGHVPAGTYKGVDEDVPGIWVVNPLVTHANVSDELIYSITKLIFEKKDELIAIQPLAAELDIQRGCVRTPAPLHPGAERYFREAGCLN